MPGPHAQQIREMLGETRVDDLRRLVEPLPLESVLPDVRASMKELTPDQVWDLWQQVGRTYDRLAGILCVAALRMPPYDVFRGGGLSPPDTESENDKARTFILETRTAEHIIGPIQGMFYPEVGRLPAGERVLAMATAHIGCTPNSNKQLNLFSMCGTFDRHQARTATHKRTTCALFGRSVLVSSGDLRFTNEMLASAVEQLRKSTDMLMAMGVQRGGGGIASGEWVSALPKRGVSQGLGSNGVLNPGDMYFVGIPSSGWLPLKPGESYKADSGHIGFVVNAIRAGNTINMETIDGGQGTDGLGTTRTIVRRFTKDANGHWAMTSHAHVNGERRILMGWVDMSKLESRFQTNSGLLIDGRRYATTL